MSDAEHPTGNARHSDADAWASACEEDLASERARRRGAHGQDRPDPAEELRRLAGAVTDGIGALGRPFGGGPAVTAVQGVAGRFVGQAHAALEPVVERNPEVFGHLAAAGEELLAACRAATRPADGPSMTKTPPPGSAPRDDGTSEGGPSSS